MIGDQSMSKYLSSFNAKYGQRHFIVLILFLCLAGQSIDFRTVLGQPKQADTEELLTTKLSSADEEQRLSALVSLAAFYKMRSGLASPSAIAVLTRVLQSDPFPIIRTHAARVLEFAGAPTATEGLLAALGTEREI